MSFEFPNLILLAAETTDYRIALDLFVALGAAAIAAILLQRLRLAVIPAFFLAGAIVGPDGFGLVSSPEFITGIAHFAVLLLLFGIGMHLDLAVLKRDFAPMVTAGLGSCLLTVAIGAPVIVLFGLSFWSAFAVAMALSLSSTAVVLRILSDRREMRHPHGRLAFAILIVQDLLVVLMLALLPLLSDVSGLGGSAEAVVEDATNSRGLPTVVQFVIKIVAASGLLAFGFIALPRIVEAAVRTGQRDVVTILGLAIACGTAAGSQWLGFSAELGAFLAGVMLSSTPFRHQLAALLAGVRDIFMAIFFTAVGMKLDLQVILASWPLILIGGMVMTAIKTAVIAASCWAVGASVGTAILVGFSLGQAGEFSLVLIDRAVFWKLIDEAIANQVFAVVILSLMFTPGLVALGRLITPGLKHVTWRAPWMPAKADEQSSAAAAEQDSDTQTDSPTVPPAQRLAVIAGYGAIGQRVFDFLEQAGWTCTVVELNAFTVRRLLTTGCRIVYGDISDPEIQEAAELAHAGLLVLTIPDDDAAVAAAAFAKQNYPKLRVAVRTHFLAPAERAQSAGADVVVADERATAEEFVRSLEAIVGSGTSTARSNPDELD